MHEKKETDRLMVEIVAKDKPRYVVEFRDPRLAFIERHNRTSCDGSVARIIHAPTPHDVPDLSFAERKFESRPA